MSAILLIRDHVDDGCALATILRSEGYDVEEGSQRLEAEQALRRRHFAVAILDLRLATSADRLNLLTHIRMIAPDTRVILSYVGDVTDEGEAVRLGAHDCITPLTPAVHVLRLVRGAAGIDADADCESQSWRRAVAAEGAIAVDPATRETFRRAATIAAADCSVLITGESGTGKEILARAIHRSSKRCNDPFVPVNCGAIAEGLVESELFGHRKGAFTGAVTDRKGLIEAADRGVLFLDEVGDTLPNVQVHLLRFLDRREIRRVGDSALRFANVRVVAATNRPIEEDVRRGRFREDLYYRLRVVGLHMPPLRKRPADIIPLARHFLQQCSGAGRPVPIVSDHAWAWLQEYHWPGNVRELRYIIEGVVITSPRRAIERADLMAARFPETPGDEGVDPARAHDDECRRLMAVLRECRGNHTLAARTLKISRTTLWRRLRSATAESR